MGSLVIVGVFGAAFVALAALVFETNQPVGPDRALQGHRLVVEGGPMWLGSRLPAEDAVQLGSRTVVIVAAGLLGLVALAWRDRIGALVAVGGPGLTGALTEYAIKHIVNVPAPVGARAFPSGHAGGVTAIALVAVILVYRRWGRLPALVAAPLAAVPAALVGIALLSLEYHYPTDVIGGALLAATVVAGVTATLSLYCCYRGPVYRLLCPDPGRQLDHAGRDQEPGASLPKLGSTGRD